VVVQVIQKYDKSGVYDINSYFPRNLANDCNSRNIKMIQISTDCVFSGQNRLDVYSETSIPDSADLYGVSKHRGEPNNCLVVRTSFIGEEFRDSPRSLIGWAMSMKGTTVNGFTNHIWNGVTTLELGNFLLKLIQNNEVQNKLIHCLTPGFISKYELLLIYNKVYNLNLTITPTRAPVTINRMLSSIYLYSKKYVTLDYEEQAYYLKEFYDKLGRGKA
jgi:dTDP-4-dehydrorhamnose reductase